MIAASCRGQGFALVDESGSWRAALGLAMAPLATLEPLREAFLAPDEAGLLTARLHPRRRQSLLVGRLAAKHALGLLRPGLDPRGVAILPGVFQQPVVSGAGLGNVQVSLAHCGSVGCALAFPEACPMGIDLERITPGQDATLASQATEAERSLAAALAVPEEARLTHLWCLKEALSKALRCGLTVPFPLLEVTAFVAEAGVTWAEFASFRQYRGMTLQAGGLVMAVVLPRILRPEWDIAPWAGWLAEASRLGGEP